MHIEALIERVWRCIWRRRLRKSRDAPGGRDGAGLEMHLDAEIEYLRDALGDQDQAELRDALGGRN
jgi:hypothetical protein